tara:strand:+ start:2319 stop:3761 length:1443 start_codon:yes stop_codon:yes gene_type:complete
MIFKKIIFNIKMTSIAEQQNNLANKLNNVSDDTKQTTENIKNDSTDFTRDKIESLGNRVRITDTDDETGLELFCYVKCDSDDSSLLRQCRGIVFHQDKIVMRAFPYTVEYNHDEVENIDKDICPVFDKCSFYDAYEGTLIRVFNFEDKWFTSTHRKLNAFKSKWASKESFGNAFIQALESEAETNEKFRNSLPKEGENVHERFQETLDKDKQYMFLVLNSKENRIVCEAPSRKTVYHVGTFIDGELTMTEDINIPYPKKHTFKDMREASDYIDSVDIRNTQGLIVFTPDNKQYKILHKEYQELFRARGNEPSIKFRYLQTRMNQRIVDMLLHLYPHMKETFDEYENILYSIARVIHTSYITRHIKNKWSQLPTEEYRVDKACHSWHSEDHKNNRVKIEKVVEFLNLQPPTSLNKMIRRHNEEKKKKNEIQDTVQTRNRSNSFNLKSPLITNQPVPSPVIVPTETLEQMENVDLPPSVLTN